MAQRRKKKNTDNGTAANLTPDSDFDGHGVPLFALGLLSSRR